MRHSLGNCLAHFVFFCLILLLLNAFAFTPKAFAAACPTDGTPVEVHLTMKQAPAQQDRQLGIRELQALSQSKDNTLGETLDREHVPLGITQTKATFTSNIRVKTITFPDKTVCASLASLDAIFQFADVKIHIANELPQGSCIENEVIGHENKHVAADNLLIHVWQQRLLNDLKHIANSVGVQRVESPEAAADELDKYIQPYLKKRIESLMEDRKQAQANVDTPAEYARVSASCDSIAGSIVQKAIGKKTVR